MIRQQRSRSRATRCDTPIHLAIIAIISVLYIYIYIYYSSPDWRDSVKSRPIVIKQTEPGLRHYKLRYLFKGVGKVKGDRMKLKSTLYSSQPTAPRLAVHHKIHNKVKSVQTGWPEAACPETGPVGASRSPPSRSPPSSPRAGLCGLYLGSIGS